MGKTTVFLISCLISAHLWASSSVNLYITVDWEGVDFHTGILDDSDLNVLKSFRRRYPHIPMVHYLNAAYFTNGSLSESEVAKRIKSVLLPIDEVGLHIHPWESLVHASGVNFITGPTYFNEKDTPFKGTGNGLFPQGHRGGDVPLWRYSKEDIRKLINFSLAKLREYGFENITSFRAGGWQTDGKVLEVLAEEDFKSESSAVPPKLVSNLYPETPLAQHVQEIWSDVKTNSQPFLQTVSKERKILMIPNNAGLADYVDSTEFMNILHENTNKINNNQAIDVVYGFHFETAEKYLYRVEQAIREALRYTKLHNIKLSVTTFQRKESLHRKSLTSKNSCNRLLKRLID